MFNGSQHHEYDALGRRVTSLNGANETLFTWDGLRLLREERGTNAVTYFYEQGSHAPLARVDGRNSLAQGVIQSVSASQQRVFYYHCNPAGLPEDLTNSEGEVVWRGRYSTWGKLVYEHTTRHAPAGFTQPLRMQGQYDDGTTGLYYNTFRYYDADAGRFTAEDPIGLAGGDNLYQYAPNPLVWADPLGLEAATMAMSGLALGAGSTTAGGGIAASLASNPLGWGIAIVVGCAAGGYLLYTALSDPAKPELLAMAGHKDNPYIGKINEHISHINGQGPKCAELERLRDEHKANLKGRHATDDDKLYIDAIIEI